MDCRNLVEQILDGCDGVRVAIRPIGLVGLARRSRDFGRVREADMMRRWSLRRSFSRTVANDVIVRTRPETAQS